MKKIFYVVGAVLSLVIAIFIMVNIFSLEKYLGGMVLSFLIMVVPILDYLHNEEWKKLWIALLIWVTVPISVIFIISIIIIEIIVERIKYFFKKDDN